ncbi:hypothetical protein Btru_070230 [Bulinus truncatus]|nr:hypothetical protein Btru_070230 [Bulinus truncatus]
MGSTRKWAPPEVYVIDYMVTQGCKLVKINIGLSTMCCVCSLTHPETYSLTNIGGYDMNGMICMAYTNHADETLI